MADNGGGVILVGDVREQLRTLPEASVHCVVTSPPYWGLRDYGVEGQLGLEPTPEEHVTAMVEVFREVRRVLRDDGTAWVNYGDCYAPSLPNGAGLKPKDLVGMPWRVAFGLQADGWYLRSDIIWAKPNPMPESVTDRPTKSHEYVFLLSKSPRYFYDADAVREPDSGRASGNGFAGRQGGARQTNVSGGRGREERHEPGSGRNLRDVWTVATHPFPGAHFATFPPDLIRPCIRAGCPEGGTVLDPFFGSGTTGLVCDQEGRDWIGVELNEEYAEIARKRLYEKQERLF